MEISITEVFLSLLLILVIGRFFAEAFFKFGIPPVVGEVVTGIIIGPSLFGLVNDNEIIKIFAEIGIILLLFEVGFESDIKKLKSEGINAFIVAFFGAFFPFLLGTLVSYYLFNINLLTSLFIGGTLTATSIGISLRVLKDLNLHLTKMASIVIGAAVLDDILGVIVLASLVQIVEIGELEIFSLLKLITLMSVFLLISPFIASLIAKVLHLFEKKHVKISGYIPIVVFSFILFFSLIAHVVGLPPIIGAFVAGIALSKRFALPKLKDSNFRKIEFTLKTKDEIHFIRKVETQVSPIISLFAPIFFVSVGISINLKEVNINSLDLLAFGIVILLVAVIGKIIGSFFVVKTYLKDKILIGISMIPRGEVGLIFAEFGKSAKIFSQDIYSALVFVIIITTLIPPILLKYAVKSK